MYLSTKINAFIMPLPNNTPFPSVMGQEPPLEKLTMHILIVPDFINEFILYSKKNYLLISYWYFLNPTTSTTIFNAWKLILANRHNWKARDPTCM